MLVFVYTALILINGISAFKWPQISTKLAKGLVGASLFISAPSLAGDDKVPSISDIKVTYKDESTKIGSLLGSKATLIFNFAGQCDLPQDGEPQCGQLIKLYQKHKEEGRLQRYNDIFRLLCS